MLEAIQITTFVEGMRRATFDSCSFSFSFWLAYAHFRPCASNARSQNQMGPKRRFKRTARALPGVLRGMITREEPTGLEKEDHKSTLLVHVS